MSDRLDLSDPKVSFDEKTIEPSAGEIISSDDFSEAVNADLEGVPQSEGGEQVEQSDMSKRFSEAIEQARDILLETFREEAVGKIADYVAESEVEDAPQAPDLVDVDSVNEYLSEVRTALKGNKEYTFDHAISVEHLGREPAGAISKAMRDAGSEEGRDTEGRSGRGGAGGFLGSGVVALGGVAKQSVNNNSAMELSPELKESLKAKIRELRSKQETQREKLDAIPRRDTDYEPNRYGSHRLSVDFVGLPVNGEIKTWAPIRGDEITGSSMVDGLYAYQVEGGVPKGGENAEISSSENIEHVSYWTQTKQPELKSTVSPEDKVSQEQFFRDYVTYQGLAAAADLREDPKSRMDDDLSVISESVFQVVDPNYVGHGEHTEVSSDGSLTVRPYYHYVYVVPDGNTTRVSNFIGDLAQSSQASRVATEQSQSFLADAFSQGGVITLRSTGSTKTEEISDRERVIDGDRIFVTIIPESAIAKQSDRDYFRQVAGEMKASDGQRVAAAREKLEADKKMAEDIETFLDTGEWPEEVPEQEDLDLTQGVTPPLPENSIASTNARGGHTVP